MTRLALFIALLLTLAFRRSATQFRAVLLEAAQDPSAQGTGQKQHPHEQQQAQTCRT